MVMLCIVLFSCKEDSKTNTITDSKASKAEEAKIKATEKQIEKALYEGYFVQNEKGFDLALKDNTIYLFKTNPSEKDTQPNFFLDVVPEKADLLNFDLPTAKISFNDSLSKNFENVAVYKVEVPKVDGVYEIIIGQYDNSGRIWSTSIQSHILNQKITDYKNEYVSNTKTNRYLDKFESAFKQGYFMMYPQGYDMLVDKNIIYFIKPTNQNVDVDTRFYLHIKFSNVKETMVLDFSGKEHQINHLLGPKYKNFTVIRKEIPSDKNMVEIGAGQFNNEGRPWQVIYDLEKMYDNISYYYDNQYKEFLTPEK
jgi:hypothetical protein